MRRFFPVLKAAIKKNRRLYSALQRVGPFYRALEQGCRKRFPRRYPGMDLRPREEKKNAPLKRRALVSYLVHPFTISPGDPMFYRHSNIWQSHRIVYILNRLGFLVDVVDFRDKGFVPKKDYDLFFGHGDETFLSIGRKLPEKSRKIYYSTSNYWRYRNRAVEERYAALSLRKGIEVRPLKMIPPIIEDVLSMANGIIGIGGEFARETYAGYPRVIMVDNTVFPDGAYDISKRDFSCSRSHFLFFAGDDNIRKGLDLLIEAFSGLNAHLWICAFIDEPITRLYEKELNHLPNIHPVGSIMPRSDLFYEIIDRCAFSILPTSSEGQPGTVAECMYYGLIQLISPACSIEVEGFGELLEECSIREIREKVTRWEAMAPGQLRSMAQKARRVAESRFSPAAFTANMTAAFKTFV
ncbi:MAG: glycosyltransferase family 4 protein [Deltaproteobacteria bacterium]|nr:glycosyltransferase family 4 protein [Deltaproteobacteria bacterium]